MSERGEAKRVSLPVLNEDPRAWDLKVWVLLTRVYNRLERRLAHVLADHGVSVPQFDVLATLCHGEGITQQQLAETLLVTKGNVVGLIDRVSAAGWVVRRPDPEDRRINRLYLTDAGRKLYEQARPRRISDITRAFEQLDESQRQQLLTLLQQLDATVEPE